jgi:hypothetical protein
MRILQWLISLPVDLAVSLSVFPLAPIVVALGKVPAWMMTPDNSIDGDEGHLARWQGKSAYLRRVAWLWRNRAYGFTALNADGIDILDVTTKGNPATSNRPFTPGWCLRTVDGYWHLYAILPYGKRFARINLGWKLWQGANFGQYVATINPVGKA